VPEQGEVSDFGGGFKNWETRETGGKRTGCLLSKAGLDIDDAARKVFLNRSAFDTRSLSEVEKLRLILGGSGLVSVNDVREITSIGRVAEAWDLLDAFRRAERVRPARHAEALSGQKGSRLLSGHARKKVRYLLVLREAYDRKWVTAERRRVRLVRFASTRSEGAARSASVNRRRLKPWAMK
jgi:hypothetical protein